MPGDNVVHLGNNTIMKLDANPDEYLGSCEVIDATEPAVMTCAKSLAGDRVEQTVLNCFEYVRDQIKHSSDFKMNPITCRASDVLKFQTGYCYAKSHLLCALLRANGIPAGLCYQRLSIDGVGPPFCLHGLNAVYLPKHRWFRIDARGNRSDVDAQFLPPNERLAFPISMDGEKDCSEIHRRPLAAVTNCLNLYTDWLDVYNNLPDLNS